MSRMLRRSPLRLTPTAPARNVVLNSNHPDQEVTMDANVTSLSLAPLCPLVDGTVDVGADSTIWEVCWEGICSRHAGGQAPAGRTDPMIPERGVVLHRECVEFWK